MSSWTAVRAMDAGPSTLQRPSVVVERVAPRAKLLLLGDAPALIRALPEGAAIPLHPNTVVRTEGLGACLWLRPNQRLLLLAGGASPAAGRIRTLDAPDAWALDAGARYVEFAVSGRGAGAVLNAGCSLDLREAAFRVDTCAQTRIDQSPVVILRAGSESFEILAERPLAAHLWLWLCRAAHNI
jgi:sarcosine oxidase, subunit gamma